MKYPQNYSGETVKRTQRQKYLNMLRLIEEYGITILDASDEADKLGASYQEYGILPERSTVDAQHIAVATVNDMDMIISLNFEHIVRKKTLEMTSFINTELGYRPIKIHSPTRW